MLWRYRLAVGLLLVLVLLGLHPAASVGARTPAAHSPAAAAARPLLLARSVARRAAEAAQRSQADSVPAEPNPAAAAGPAAVAAGVAATGDAPADTVLMEMGARVGGGEHGFCELCMYAVHQVQYGELPSCAAAAKTFTMSSCSQVVQSMLHYAHDVMHLISYGCYQYSAYRGWQTVRPCPSHVICGRLPNIYTAEKEQMCPQDFHYRFPHALSTTSPKVFNPLLPFAIAQYKVGGKATDSIMDQHLNNPEFRFPSNNPNNPHVASLRAYPSVSSLEARDAGVEGGNVAPGAVSNPFEKPYLNSAVPFSPQAFGPNELTLGAHTSRAGGPFAFADSYQGYDPRIGLSTLEGSFPDNAASQLLSQSYLRSD